eukprot:Em0045g13a
MRTSSTSTQDRIKVRNRQTRTGPNWFSGQDKLVSGQLFNPRAGSGQEHRKAAGSGSTLDSDWCFCV